MTVEKIHNQNNLIFPTLTKGFKTWPESRQTPRLQTKADLEF
jgi:hypothetical protein